MDCLEIIIPGHDNILLIKCELLIPIDLSLKGSRWCSDVHEVETRERIKINEVEAQNVTF